MRRSIIALVWLIASVSTARAQQLLVPMDLTQSNHLKAYGLAFGALSKGHKIDWLLNYRGGSFLMPAANDIVLDARLKDVTFVEVTGSDIAQIHSEIAQNNMEIVHLEKAPKVAVYIPPLKQPWDDAVTLALEYAEIPYARIFDDEVLANGLDKYDWLHLHHEDFTGQYGKFYAAYRHTDWYQAEQRTRKHARGRWASPRCRRRKRRWPKRSASMSWAADSCSRCAPRATRTTSRSRPAASTS